MRTEVFSINFIRRPFITFPMHQVSLYVIFGCFLLQVGVITGLLGYGAWTHFRTEGLQMKFKGEMSPKEEVQLLKEEIAGMGQQGLHDLGELQAALAAEKDRFRVGDKLAAIAQTLPLRTWITQLSYDSDKKTLLLHASYLVDPEKPYELPVKKWVEALRADARTADKLKGLHMVQSARTAQESGSQLFTFQLAAEWDSK